MIYCPMCQNQGDGKMARHEYIYVLVGDQLIKVENPYDYIPDNVELKKYKGNYKVIVKENKE